MPSVRTTPITGEIYHIYNRGVEKRDVFCERVDYVRFIHNLFEFNSTKQAPEFSRRHRPDNNVGYRKPHIEDSVVEILAFCLMKNHYHLLLRQVRDKGIPLFMQKLGAGYANAFNQKNNRVGPLFQGKYKAKHVDNDEYLQHLVGYIHLNPLTFCKTLNEDKSINVKRTWDALNQYKWSSHLDYLGEENFGSVIKKELILELLGGELPYKEFIKDWVRHESQRLSFVAPIAIDLDFED